MFTILKINIRYNYNLTNNFDYHFFFNYFLTYSKVKETILFMTHNFLYDTKQKSKLFFGEVALKCRNIEMLHIILQNNIFMQAFGIDSNFFFLIHIKGAN